MRRLSVERLSMSSDSEIDRRVQVVEYDVRASLGCLGQRAKV